MSDIQRTTFQFPRELLRRIDERAGKEGRSRNMMVQTLLYRILDEDNGMSHFTTIGLYADAGDQASLRVGDNGRLVYTDPWGKDHVLVDPIDV